MTQIELKAALNELSEKKNSESVLHVEQLYSIQSKRDYLVRSANDHMRKERLQETIRYKEAMAAIEKQKIQLLAEYKAAKTRAKAETAAKKEPETAAEEETAAE